VSNFESEELRRLRLTEGSSVVDVLQRSTGSRAQQQSAGEFVPLDHRQAKCIEHRLNSAGVGSTSIEFRRAKHEMIRCIVLWANTSMVMMNKVLSSK
jgi:hypothetical protein